MIIPNTHLCKRVFFFVALFFLTVEAQAQCNPEEGGATCGEAEVVCLTNLCDETEQNVPDNSYAGFCGQNTVINNPQYFAFIPTEPNVFFQILVGGCTGGQSALQAAILSACPWTGSAEVIDCNPGSGQGSYITLIATDLVVGQTYYLVFDGSAGALCDYTIEVATGVYEPQLMGDIDDVQANPAEPVCQGYLGFELTASPEVEGAHGYWWIPEWAPQDTIETTEPILSIDIPATLDPGTYEICVQAFSGCDVGDAIICIDIEVYEIPEEEKPEEYFCPEEFPIQWGSLVINGPGEYEQTFTTAEGCAFDSLWVVEEYPEVPVGVLDTLHCEESLFYEGNFYDDAGTYDLSYPGMGSNGCDSTAELNVTLAAIDAFIELSCENGEFVLEVLVQSLVPTTANLEYEWYEGTTIISTDEKLYVLDGGNYSVIVEVITPAGSCFFDLDPFFFDAAQFRPDPPNLGFTDTIVCAQSGVFFEVIPDPFADPYTYTWSGPANVPIFQDGSNIAEFDFSASGPAEICVYATNECGDGPPFCFMVDIQQTPVADFTFDLDVCTDSIMIVTFTGIASPQAVITWDFDNPTTLVGTGLGPYMVSWSTPGDKLINLTLEEPGCDTDFNSGIVTVHSFLPPVVNCSSTIESVHFEWNDVAGANGYLVSINGGAPVTTANSEWDELGLTPGTVITMDLTVISGGPCDDIVITAMCTAEDCPPPTIILSGDNTSCLNSPAIIDLDATVDGNPGTGSWSGAGIVDANAGLFDPTMAGSGPHQLSYTVDVNGCPFTATFDITVFDSITADFILDPLICETDMAGVTYTGNASSGAVYTYTFGSATVVSGTGEGPYELSWATPGTKTVRLQVSENGCMSDVITHTTDVIAELNAPVINCSPNTSGILFSWRVDPSAASHIVNTLMGPAGIPVGTDSLDFTGLNPGDEVQIEIVTISAGPCPDRRDTLSCIARQCPTPVITLTPANDVCLYPGTGTQDLEVTVTNGAGSGYWAGPGITNPTTGIWDPVIAGAGAHQVTFNYTDDGCNFVENMAINVYDIPEAFISNTDLMITCATGSIILNGSSSSGGPLSYQWSTSGTGVIDNGATTAMAEVIAQGVYQLLVENSVSGCVDSTSVTVTQDANIPIADAGPDQTITCDDVLFTLGGNSSTGVNIVYNWTTPDGRIIGPITEIMMETDLNGEYTITVRDTSNGCQATDRAIVGIDTAVATVTLTPGDLITCSTPTSTVLSAINGGNAADYTFSWTTMDGTIVGSTTGQSIEVSQGGIYTLSIEQNDNGCQYTQDVLVDESDEIINAVEVTSTNVICHGDNNGTISVVNVMGGTPPYEYAWTGTPQVGTELTNLGPGFYTLVVTDQNGCSLTESYEVVEPPQVTLSVGPDMTVRISDSVFISTITNLLPGAIDDISWSSGNGSITCPGCPTISFIASSSTTITSMIVDTSGCNATDSMRLTVIVPKIFYIPNVFSPNDDNINDFFTIWGRFNLVNIGYLRIFDRWGNQVFENLDFEPNVESEGWDGRFNGEPMAPGVYVYTALLEYEDGVSENISGSITILR